MKKNRFSMGIRGVVMCVLALCADFSYASNNPIIRAKNPVPGEYVVILRDSAPVALKALDLVTQYQGVLLQRWDRLNAFHVTMSREKAELLNLDELVELIEEEGVGSVSQVDVVDPGLPIDPMNPEILISQPFARWHLYRGNIKALPAGGLNTGDETNYTYTYFGNGYLVDAYVFDNGIWAGHDEFNVFPDRVEAGINKVNEPDPLKNCVALDAPGNDPTCGGQVTSAAASHGTAVASVLGGKTYGVAKRVSLIPVRVVDNLGNSRLSWVMAGIDWVLAQRLIVKGPAVANFSFYNPADDLLLEDLSALDRGVYKLINDGIFVTASANNKRNCAPLTACELSPSRAPRVVTVGGTDEADKVWVANSHPCNSGGVLGPDPGTNWGACVDIYAPAKDIKTAAFTASDGSFSTGGSRIRSGTSFAAPQVAGIAAIYLERHVGASPVTVWGFLERNATKSKVKKNLADREVLTEGLVPPPSGLIYTKLVMMNILRYGSRPNGNQVEDFFVYGSNFQAGCTVLMNQEQVEVSEVLPYRITFDTPWNMPRGRVMEVTVQNPNDNGDGILKRGLLIDFVDVPDTHSFHPWIVPLARNGVTLGCSNPVGGYCPDAEVTRTQMALFLLRAEHGSTYVPPAVYPSPIFCDVDHPLGCDSPPPPPGSPNPNKPFIEQLWREIGEYADCDPSESVRKFCPNIAITRQDMARFLIASKYGKDYIPPDPDTYLWQPTFPIDVPWTNPYARWIEKLAADGVVNGCGTERYCPTAPVLRSTMSKFLVLTYTLQ